MLKRLILGLLTVVAIGSVACAQLPNPVLDAVYPPGGQAGTAFVVRVAGRDLDQGQRLVFSHPGVTATPATRAPTEFESTSQTISNQFDVTIPLNVPPGPYDVRLVGRYGISTPRTFMVSAVNECLEEGDHHTADTAVSLPLDEVMNGRTDASAVDYYRFSAAKNQHVIIECLASQIDSPLVPIVTVWSTNGTPLLRSQQLIDPILEFTAEHGGEFILGVHDHVFAGGDLYAYRLQIHSGPYVVAVSPTAALPGRPTTFLVHGCNLPGGESDNNLQWNGRPLERKQVTLFVPPRRDAPRPRLVSPVSTTEDGFRFRWPTPRSNAKGRFIAFADHDVLVESEPNDTPTSAQTVPIPCDVSGRFYPRRDQDWIRLSAKQGQAYQVRVVSHRLGNPTDPEVIVQRIRRNANGQVITSQVTTQDDFRSDRQRFRGLLRRGLDISHRDPVVRFMADHDGQYVVGLRNLNVSSHDDPRFDYRVVIEHEQPSFELLAWTQQQSTDDDKTIDRRSIVLRRGDSLPILIDVLRHAGFDQEIVVRATKLPSGVTAAACHVAPGLSEAAVVLTASQDATAWCGSFQIIGEAVVDGHRIHRRAREVVLRDRTDNIEQQRPFARQTRQTFLAVIDHETPLARLEIAGSMSDDPSHWQTSIGANLAIPVRMVAYAKLSDKVNLSAIGLPEQIQAETVTLKPGEDDAALKLSMTEADLRPGRYTFFLRGKIEGEYARNPQAIPAAQENRVRFDKVINELAEQIEYARAALIQMQSQPAHEPHAAEVRHGNFVPNQDVADADVHGDTSRDEVAKAEAEIDELTQKQERAEAYAKTLDQQVSDAKTYLGPKEIQMYVNSPSITVDVLRSPIKAMVRDEVVTLRRGTTVDVKVPIHRRFGFADTIELHLEIPDDIQNVRANMAAIPKEQEGGILTLTAGLSATLGRHTLFIKPRLQFNGVDIEDRIPLHVIIQE